MKERNRLFIEAGKNYIIVEKLTPEIIEETIKAVVEENRAYLLKKIDSAVFNKLQTEYTEYLKELNELDNS